MFQTVFITVLLRSRFKYYNGAGVNDACSLGKERKLYYTKEMKHFIITNAECFTHDDNLKRDLKCKRFLKYIS